ncbi:MAG: protease inhibitor I42 family protein [Parvularculaceae bacterium]
MIKHLFIAAALALGGCAAKHGGESEQHAFKSIAAPTRPDIATHITGEDDGKSVSVSAGTKIAVELIGVPTAGYVWMVKEQPAFLAAAGETGGPTSEAQLQPGFAGGSHWEVFYFDVTGSGEGALSLEQRRPWEEEGPPDATFSVTIKAP